MRIIIEEYQYDADKVRDVLSEIDALEILEGKVSVNYVGYFYNHIVKDCVFILPKVLLEVKKEIDEETGKTHEIERVFGKHKPEDIINLNENNPLSDIETNFIYEFAVWIYRTISVFYNDKSNDTSIVYHKIIPQVGRGQRHLSNTFLDIILSLIKFNKENQNFFFYILRNIHAGFNKINWTKTINRTSAIIQNDVPVYINPVNKKRKINFDEELLVIYFSILNYVNEIYGFDTTLNVNFELIKGAKFKAYMNGVGLVRLRQIKYKYFSDKALELWEMCFAFFDRAKKIVVETGQKDYLLVKNFNIVFESIIDKLIGTPHSEVPKGLMDQDDGKQVDHMYAYKGLTTHEDKPIYYIGDSKYYKRGHKIGKESVYKQFTYARNVIQWNLNLFLDPDKHRKEQEQADKAFGEHVDNLRDNITEGYNVIPNFFISAKMGIQGDNDEENNDEKKLFSYQKYLEYVDDKKQDFESRQFPNRLFDRDTLLICHYNVNFLYIVSLYARNSKSEEASWRNEVRETFRTKVQEILKKKYDFYAMQAYPKVDGKKYIREHFQELLGKIYTPFDDKNTYSLALNSSAEFKEDNEKLKAKLKDFFYVEPLTLGYNPENAITQAISENPSAAAITNDADEENILALHIDMDDNYYKSFRKRMDCQEYELINPPMINLHKLKYFLPIVDGGIKCYYEIGGVDFGIKEGTPCLKFHFIMMHDIGHFTALAHEEFSEPTIVSLKRVLDAANDN